MDFLRQTINILADLMVTLILLRIILSWLVRDENRLTHFLKEATEPILGPIRKAIPRIGMFDISPIVALLLIDIIRKLLNNYLL